jgi:hypothetical protein
MRAAAVGGAAYYAGKKVQEGRDGEAAEVEGEPEPEAEAEAPAAITDDTVDQLERLAELKEKGVLTQEEFDAQKQKLLG